MELVPIAEIGLFRQATVSFVTILSIQDAQIAYVRTQIQWLGNADIVEMD